MPPAAPSRRHCWLPLLIGAAVAVLPLQSLRAQSFEAALPQALAAHPLVTQAERGHALAEASRRQAVASRRPSLDLRARGGAEWERDESTGPRAAPAGSVEARAAWTLMDGGAADAREGQALIQGQIAALALRRVRQEVTAEALLRYLSLYQAKQLLLMAETERSLAAERLALAEGRLEEGAGDQLQVTVARIRLAQASSRLAQRDQELQVALIGWRRWFGGLKPDLESLVLPAQMASALPRSREALRDLVAEGNPGLAAARAEIDRLTLGQDLAAAPSWPRLEAYGSARAAHGDNARRDSRLTAEAGLELRWSLYDGGATEARVLEAALLTENGRDSLRAQTDEAAEAAELAWVTLEVARERLMLAEESVMLTRRLEQAAQAQIEEGGGAPDTVLDARSQRLEAEALRLEALVAVRLQEAALLRAVGALDPTLFGGGESPLSEGGAPPSGVVGTAKAAAPSLAWARTPPLPPATRRQPGPELAERPVAVEALSAPLTAPPLPPPALPLAAPDPNAPVGPMPMADRAG